MILPAIGDHSRSSIMTERGRYVDTGPDVGDTSRLGPIAAIAAPKQSSTAKC